MSSALLERLLAREDVDEASTEAFFAAVVRGEVPDVLLAGVLIAWRAKRERPAEIAAAARALVGAARPFPRPDGPLVDCCGTGGDGQGTVNVSTAVAFVAAELGLRVAKHGNRSISSRCGSADVLEAAGVVLDPGPDRVAHAIEAAGVGFLLAPAYHAGLRHAAGARRGLGVRTLFNLLGPLLNPARPSIQLVGVYAPELVTDVARTLGLLGVSRALVVHGSGLDEVALHGPTTAALWSDGEVTTLTIEPEAVGVKAAPIEALRGGDAPDNARWLAQVLAGRGDEASTDAVALNAGVLAFVAGVEATIADGVARARACILGGRARDRLDHLVELTHA